MRDRLQDVDSEGGALLRAKAMAAPSRVAILARLRESAGPLSIGDLAALVGLHRTAVQRHLALLADAGLVRSQPLPINGRGRPRTGFVSVDEGAPYRELAGMLADAVRSGSTAREAGRKAGALVVPSPQGPIDTLRAEAERLGFNPQMRDRGGGHEIVLRTCPFADLATSQPDTVCELHVGLAEGIAEQAGGLIVDGIRLADPQKGGCQIIVRPTAT